MKRNMTYLLTAFILTGFTIGCSENSTEPESENTDFSSILTNLSVKVITATYSELNLKAGNLETAVLTLQSDLSAEKLESARSAWRATRKPWEQSEGFLFGPVDTKGIDPAIDSWPLNKQDLDAVLGGSASLTKEYIDGLETTLKGFHTIEYLLFGENGTKLSTEFTARELDYLVATAKSLKGETQKLENSWVPSGENYQANLVKAGESSSLYTSQQSAMQEIINGMIAIADEVANGKINDPLVEQNILLEESRFSDNSKEDFQDNIRSIQNLFTGSYLGSTGAGLSAWLQTKNAALNTRLDQEIADAIQAIGTIPGTFSEAITANKAAVETAQTKVRTVQTTLEESVLPLLTK